jgi:SAM-dependent methyltransferase
MAMSAVGSAAARAVAWHDLECCAYEADLPLWRELAGHAHGPVLEIGAGTGRVSLALARAGHEAIALDRDGALLEELERRAAGLPVHTVQADAREFALGRRDLALCLAPMQTVQLLGGSRGRLSFLRCVRAHLRPGGLLACAIVTEVEPFDTTKDDLPLSAQTLHAQDALYVSRPVRERVHDGRILIEHERERREPTGAVERDLQRIQLDLLGAEELEREGEEAGLRPLPRRAVPPTEEHLGSTVVILGG